MTEQAGWYYAKGDPDGTTRYWDGSKWQGEPQDAPDLRTAGLGNQPMVKPSLRVLGRIIDWALTGMVVVPLWLAGRVPDEGIILGLSTKWLAIIGGLLFVWDSLWVGLLGATPGKLILGYRVVNVSNDPTPSIVTGALRAFHRLLMMVPGVGEIIWLLVGLVSLGLMMSGKSNQSVMDRLAGTKVTAASVRVDSPAAAT